MAMKENTLRKSRRNRKNVEASRPVISGVGEVDVPIF